MAKPIALVLVTLILSASYGGRIHHYKQDDIYSTRIDYNDIQYAPLRAIYKRFLDLKEVRMSSLEPTKAQDLYAVNISTTNSSHHTHGMNHKSSEYILPLLNGRNINIQPLAQHNPLETKPFKHHAENQKVSKNILKENKYNRFTNLVFEENLTNSTTIETTNKKAKPQSVLADYVSRNDPSNERHRLLINTAHSYSSDMQRKPRGYKVNSNLKIKMMPKKILGNTRLFASEIRLFRTKFN